MSYALILESDANDTEFWYCYHIANSAEDFQNLECYRSADLLMLSKHNYTGELLEETLTFPSCETGDDASFVICKIEEPIPLSNIIVSI